MTRTLPALAAAALMCLTANAMAAENAASAQDEGARVVKEMGLRESPTALRDTKGWTQPKKVVVLADGPERLAFFQEAVKGVTLVPARGFRDALGQMKDADGLVGLCSAELVNAAPKLRWIQSQGAGVDECIPALKGREDQIVLTNMQRVNGPNVSEQAMALVLALSRQINAFVANQRDEKWDLHTPHPIWDLEGRTMLIAGLGGIGTDIAERAHAFGMKITATRASGHEGPAYVSYVGTADELPKLIGDADFVVNVLPLTPETTGLFNAAMFARMKKGAYFINVGRGQTAVTDDLVAALKSGQVGGAGLDVVDPEPLPKGHALWHIPNVIITSHSGGTSEMKFERAWLVMRENLRRFAAGDKLLSVVDAKRGY